MKRYSLPVMLVLALCFSGCMGARNMKHVRYDIMDQMPGAEFDRSFGLYVGSAAVATARLITRLVDDEDAAKANNYLKNVHRARVSIYEVSGDFDPVLVSTPAPLQRLADRGWDMAVRVRDEDGSVWVMYKDDQVEISDIYVVTLSDDELVMVRAHGNFTELLDQVMREEDLAREMFTWR